MEQPNGTMQQNINEATFASSADLGADSDSAGSEWVVMKFGGSSMVVAANWAVVAGLVRNRIADGLRPVIVLSALKGVSNTLEKILGLAISGEAAAVLTELRKLHYQLASELSLAGPAILDETFAELDRLAAGISQVGKVSPRIHALVVAQGELLSSRLFSAFLSNSGIDVAWQDARQFMTSEQRRDHTTAQNVLSANCPSDPDKPLQLSFAAHGKAILTQGFIAANRDGDTVLLGREGSDTSAAYLAAKLQAHRVEIWTDVPGMFTADPNLVPSARLLVHLQFDEAQELAATGSKVLHPRSISPLRHNGIPLFIRCTSSPGMVGTVISASTKSGQPQVKGVSVRSGVTLVSMEGSAMWHQVGFLARVFTIFARHDISIDLISTSENNVTVSVDAEPGMLADAALPALLDDLEPLCRVRLISDCAVISLVGRKIRANLSRLAPAFSVFEEENIHLLTHSASDLNVSFVVDQEQMPKLLGKLHASIISKSISSKAFGPSWEELSGGAVLVEDARPAWWQEKREMLLEVAGRTFNAYVYDSETIGNAARQLTGMHSIDRVLYAVKANFNPEVLRLLASEGVDFDCVSPAEVRHLQNAVQGLETGRILFTPNFAPREEYEWAVSQGLLLTLDNLYPLQAWPEIFERQKLFVRLDPGRGYGHHEHVKTAGVHSKFGIPRFEIDELVDLVKSANVTVTGIHAHSGSGILEPDTWRTIALELINVAARFPDVQVLDLGGGMGVPEKIGDAGFDITALDKLLQEIKAAYPTYKLWLEPGRFLVSQAGVLLTRVTQIKGKGDMRYIGVGTGMNSLIRPALYGAFHEIVNLSRIDEPATEMATVVGPICETGDKLGSDRLLPRTAEGDVMLVANAGAYGHVMGSRYNLREVAEEIFI